MSYSGFTERLCLTGHFFMQDAYATAPEHCSWCGKSFRYFHGVDQTNGYDESIPGSCCAPKEEIGFEDHWREDHYGNRYSVKIPLYTPIGSEWVKVNSKGNATPPYLDDLAQGIEARSDETAKQAQPEGQEPGPKDAPND